MMMSLLLVFTMMLLMMVMIGEMYRVKVYLSGVFAAWGVYVLLLSIHLRERLPT